MPQTARFLSALETQGYNFFTGVPCSYLQGVIRRFDEEPRWGYVSAVREDSAVGIAAGAYMADKKPAVFLQNSGLGVCLNALVSLNIIYEIPVLLVASWRGQDGKDAPEHIVMGEIMTSYFGQIKLPWRVLDADTIEEDVATLSETIAARRVPGGLIVPKGILDASS